MICRKNSLFLILLTHQITLMANGAFSTSLKSDEEDSSSVIASNIRSPSIDFAMRFFKSANAENVEQIADDVSEKVKYHINHLLCYQLKDTVTAAGIGDKLKIYVKLDKKKNRTDIVNNIFKMIEHSDLEYVIKQNSRRNQSISFDLKAYIEDVIIANIVEYDISADVKSAVKKFLSQSFYVKNSSPQKSEIFPTPTDQYLHPETNLSKILTYEQFISLQSCLDKILYDIKKHLNNKIHEKIKNFLKEAAEQRFAQNEDSIVNVTNGLSYIGTYGLTTSLFGPISYFPLAGISMINGYFIKSWMSKKTTNHYLSLVDSTDHSKSDFIRIDQAHAGFGNFAEQEDGFLSLEIESPDLITWVKNLNSQ